MHSICNIVPTSTILLQKTRKEPSCRRFAPPSRTGQAWSVPSAASPGPLPAGDVEKGQEIAALSVSSFRKRLMLILKKCLLSYCEYWHGIWSQIEVDFNMVLSKYCYIYSYIFTFNHGNYTGALLVLCYMFWCYIKCLVSYSSWRLFVLYVYLSNFYIFLISQRIPWQLALSSILLQLELNSWFTKLLIN